MRASDGQNDGLAFARTLGRALPLLSTLPAAVLGLLLAVALHVNNAAPPTLLVGVCFAAIAPRLAAGLANAIGGVRRELVEASLALGGSRLGALRLALRGDATVARNVFSTLRTALLDATVTVIALRLVIASPSAMSTSSLWPSLAPAILLVVIALALAAPIGLWSAWALSRGPSPARTGLRFLGQVPIALLVLVLMARAESLSLGAWALAAFLLGVYAPLTLGVAEVTRLANTREADEALALGASPRQVWLHIVLPSSARSLRTLAVGCGVRLLGEAGLFLIVLGPRLGA